MIRAANSILNRQVLRHVAAFFFLYLEYFISDMQMQNEIFDKLYLKISIYEFKIIKEINVK